LAQFSKLLRLYQWVLPVPDIKACHLEVDQRRVLGLLKGSGANQDPAAIFAEGGGCMFVEDPSLWQADGISIGNDMSRVSPVIKIVQVEYLLFHFRGVPRGKIYQLGPHLIERERFVFSLFTGDPFICLLVKIYKEHTWGIGAIFFLRLNHNSKCISVFTKEMFF